MKIIKEYYELIIGFIGLAFIYGNIFYQLHYILTN